MDETTRGSVYNEDRARQIRDFSGMRYGSKTPTDIDGLIEDSELCYVFFETKCKGTDLPEGQEKALVRLCDDLGTIKPTLLLVSEHETKPEEKIDVANTVVVKYRFEREWHFPSTPFTTRRLVDRFLGKHGTWHLV
jgi:hypothetical protein